ncbi:MAG: hypothetical protein PHF63_01100 [Herbinix sp.]|nr:hypothetical protein [Herbinix sp.]
MINNLEVVSLVRIRLKTRTQIADIGSDYVTDDYIMVSDTVIVINN